jgi:putative membrane protein
VTRASASTPYGKTIALYQHGRENAFCFGAAIWRQVFPGPPPPQPDTPRIPPALLVVVNGFLVLVALSALISIWFGRIGGD